LPAAVCDHAAGQRFNQASLGILEVLLIGKYFLPQ
jgi:hypothetical protein